MPSQGEDLAVLSLSNHSIIGVRGGLGKLSEKYNLFGKLDLAGGEVIYPTGYGTLLTAVTLSC